MKTIVHRHYALIDPRDGRVRYVGTTTKTVARRLIQHRCDAKTQCRLPVHRWIRKLTALGLEPAAVLLEQCADRERERHWIAYYRAIHADLLNLTDGGEGCQGVRWSDESREAARQRQIERCKSESYRDHLRQKAKQQAPHSAEARERIAAANRGRKHPPLSPEARARISAAQIGRPGRPWTDEQRQKAAAANTGKKHSPETRAKISAAQKGRVRESRSPEVKEKIRAALTGRKRPPEVAEKVRAALLGKPTGRYYPPSPEGKARMIASKKGRPNPCSEARARAISAAKKGKPHKSQGPLSEATKARLSAVNRAFPVHAKLSHDDVRAIRARWAAGAVMQKELALEFGVRPSTIGAIIQGRTWAHVV